MIKKVLSVFIVATLIGSFSLKVPAAEAASTDFLRDEAEEALRHVNEANAAIQNMQQMIQADNQQIAKLEQAITDLDGFHEKMRMLQKINIAKATITAMFDFKDWVMLLMPGGTVVGMIVSIATQYASTKVGGALNYNAPYKKAMKRVESEAVGMDNALKAIDNALTMTLDEVRKTGGNAAELGDTGAILRKYTLIMNACRKAQSEAEDLIDALEDVNEDLEKDIASTRKKIETYQKRADEYMSRLREAEGKEMEKKVQEAWQQAKDSFPQGEEAELPQKIKGKDTKAMYNKWLSSQQPLAIKAIGKHKELARKVERAYNEYVAAWTNLRDIEKRDGVLVNRPTTTLNYETSEYMKVDNWYPNGALLVAGITLDDQLAGEAMLSVDPWSIAAAHANAVEAKRHLSGQGEVSSSLSACDEIESRIVALMTEYDAQSRNQAVIKSVIHNGHATGYSIPVIEYYDGNEVHTAKTPEALVQLEKKAETVADFGVEASVSEMLKAVVEERLFLEKMADEKPTVMNAYTKRITQLKSAFTSLMVEKKKEYKKALSVMTNAENAAVQVVAASSAYATLIKNSPWSQSGSFSVDLLCNQLFNAFKSQDTARLDEIRTSFSAFKIEADSLHNKYRIGLGNIAAYKKNNTYKSHGILDIYKDDMKSELRGLVYSEEKLGQVSDEIHTAEEVTSVEPFDVTIDTSILFVAPDLIDDILIGYPKTSKKRSAKKKLKMVQELVERLEAFAVSSPVDNKIVAALQSKLKEYEKLADLEETVEGARGTAPSEMDEDDDDDGQILEWWRPQIFDVRVNTKRVGNVRGELVLTNESLINGEVTITARIEGYEHLAKMLISTNGGGSWKEIERSGYINYSFVPVPGQLHEIVLRADRKDTGQKLAISLLPTGSSIVYRNVNYVPMVLDSVQKIADSYEAQDVSGFARLISRDYLGNKTFLEEGVRFDFDMFSDITLKLYVNRIERRKDMYVAETRWDKIQIPRTTGEQQRTTGRTTILFTLEEGVMKILNLRGNLLYATLSPEIAEASGLKTSVVDQIRTARDDRNPTQPGAGEIEDAGGVTSGGSSAAITVYTASRDADSGFPGENFDFEGRTWTENGAPAAQYDITFEGGLVFDENGATYQVLGTSFDATTEVPAGGYAANPGAMNAGQVWAFITAEGNYGKLEITEKTDIGGGTFRYGFKFAVQTDSTRNVTT